VATEMKLFVRRGLVVAFCLSQLGVMSAWHRSAHLGALLDVDSHVGRSDASTASLCATDCHDPSHRHSPLHSDASRCRLCHALGSPALIPQHVCAGLTARYVVVVSVADRVAGSAILQRRSARAPPLYV